MKFLNFLNEYTNDNSYDSNHRGVTIDEKSAFKIFEKNCNVYSLKYNIHRGISHKGDFYMIDPTKSLRISRNTSNFYTLLMDNLPNWSKYPKRSKSIICTTNYGQSQNYGHSYTVLPFKDAKIGICPARDLWDVDNGTVLNINFFIKDIFHEANINFDEKRENFEDLCNKLMSVEGMLSKEIIATSFFETTNVKFKDDTSIIDNIQNVLDPGKLGFVYSTGNTYRDTDGDSNEVWIEGKSLLISDSVYTKFMMNYSKIIYI